MGINSFHPFKHTLENNFLKCALMGGNNFYPFDNTLYTTII